jgi:hypothetical protein
VPTDRRIELARIRCVDGTCSVRRIQVRYNIGGRVLNGVGTAPSTIGEGRTGTVSSVMPADLYSRLRSDRVSGTVTVVATVSSSNGTLVNSFVRTGLRR